MQLKHATEYKCFLLHTHTLSTAEKQLNELFEDGWLSQLPLYWL